jgi:hypothetical protein
MDRARLPSGAGLSGYIYSSRSTRWPIICIALSLLCLCPCKLHGSQLQHHTQLGWFVWWGYHQDNIARPGWRGGLGEWLRYRLIRTGDQPFWLPIASIAHTRHSISTTWTSSLKLPFFTVETTKNQKILKIKFRSQTIYKYYYVFFYTTPIKKLRRGSTPRPHPRPMSAPRCVPPPRSFAMPAPAGRTLGAPAPSHAHAWKHPPSPRRAPPPPTYLSPTPAKSRLEGDE